MATVFVSYRRKQSAEVDALATALRDDGLDVWLDREDMDAAASIQRCIDQGLAESHALLAWYGKDYPQSRS